MAAPPNTQTKAPVPWVTLVLIFLNLVASLLALMDHNILLEYSFSPSQPSLVAAFTNLFLHSNLIHLLGNMVFLAAVGPWAESVAGRIPFALIYLCGGLIGVAAHVAMMRAISSSLPLMGASGAIAACAGYCAVRFMNHRVPLAPRTTVTVGTVTLIWVALQGLGVFVKAGNDPGGTAFWTHLAGFLVGLLASLLLKAPKQAKIQFGHDILDKMGDRGPGALLHAAESHLETHPNDPRALRDMATAYHQMGDYGHEAETLVKVLDVVPVGSRPQVLEQLAECNGLNLLPAIKRLQWAEGAAADKPLLAKMLLKSVMNDPASADDRPSAIMSLVPLVDAKEAELLLHDLKTNHAMDPVTDIARTKGLIQ